MAIKINFVLFERTLKVIYEDPLQLFRTLLAWFSKYFDQKQCAIRHLGIIFDRSLTEFLMTSQAG